MWSFSQDSVIAKKGVGQPLSLIRLSAMNGIFHLFLLVAAGEILLPFRRKKLDIGEASCWAWTSFAV